MVPFDNPLTVPLVVVLDTSTAELVPTFLDMSHTAAVLAMQNKVQFAAGTPPVALGVQVNVTAFVVGVPETTGFPGAEGATAVAKHNE